MLSKVITISQQKGGTGKTTLAIHLAMGFIKFQNLKVAVVDTDPQGSLGQWFMIRSEKNISNEYKPSEIFKASDMMVDSLTQLLERESNRSNHRDCKKSK